MHASRFRRFLFVLLLFPTAALAQAVDVKALPDILKDGGYVIFQPTDRVKAIK